jgi:hypothetical protein
MVFTWPYLIAVINEGEKIQLSAPCIHVALHDYDSSIFEHLNP